MLKPVHLRCHHLRCHHLRCQTWFLVSCDEKPKTRSDTCFLAGSADGGEGGGHPPASRRGQGGGINRPDGGADPEDDLPSIGPCRFQAVRPSLGSGLHEGATLPRCLASGSCERTNEVSEGHRRGTLFVRSLGSPPRRCWALAWASRSFNTAKMLGGTE